MTAQDALRAYEAGQFARAVEICSRLLRSRDGDGQVWQIRGYAELAAGRAADAIKSLRKALKRGGDELACHIGLGQAYEGTGDVDKALDSYLRVLALRPNDAHYRINTGNFLYSHGRVADAIEQYQAAIRLEPGSSDAYANLGIAWSALDELPKALDALQRGLALNDRDPVLHNNLASVYVKLNRTTEAIASFEAVLERSPGNALAELNLAQAFLELGRFEDARRHYTRALELGLPGEEEIHVQCQLAELMPDANAAIQLLSARLDDSLTDEGRSAVHSALGRLNEKLGSLHAAFEQYHACNRIRSKGHPYVPGETEKLVRAIEAAYDAAVFEEGRAGLSTGGNRIFIVGMPRSGTSLLEQLICRHRDVVGAGEVDYYTQRGPGLLQRVQKCLKGAHRDCRELTDELARGYLERMTVTARPGRYTVDKMPMNFFYLGFIRAGLPGAKFIHLRRNPVDTCLSNYFQNFKSVDMYAWSNDQADLVHFYHQYERIMAFWEQRLEEMLTIDYEALVADSDRVLAGIYDFIGLDPLTGAGHATLATPSRTASLSQVRESVYTTSSGRWRRWAAFIPTLLDAFGEQA